MYAIKKSLYLSVSAIILCGGSGNVFAYDLPQTTHTRHISLSKSAPSYQVASIQWLPDALEEGLKFSGFKSYEDGHGKDNDCSDYDLTSCPKGWKCLECTKGLQTKYKKNGCDDSYEPNEDRTKCNKKCSLPNCVDKVTSKPDNSSYTTESCTDCSGSKTIKTGWTCNQGFSPQNDKCAEVCTLPDCVDKVSTKPENSSYTTETCTDCSRTKEIKTGWECNEGYHKNGDVCDRNYENEKKENTCASGKVLVNNTCVDCVSDLVFDGSRVATTITYNGVKYAMLHLYSPGTSWNNVKKTCSQGIYDLPSTELAKYLMPLYFKGLENISFYIRTSEACSTPGEYKGCDSETNCECKNESNTVSPGPVCVAYACQDKHCQENDCEGFTLDECPKVATCSSCNKISSDCSEQRKYKITSCKDGYSLVDGECVCEYGKTVVNGKCVECATSLTFRNDIGWAYIAKKITYNGEDYAVALANPHNHGIGKCSVAIEKCKATSGYSIPDVSFASYLIKNKDSLGISDIITYPGICSGYTGSSCIISTLEGGTNYLSDDKCGITTAVCVARICPNAKEESCPDGYQLDKCSFSNKIQTGTTQSSLGYTCYKCEDLPSSSDSNYDCGDNPSHRDCRNIHGGTMCGLKKCYIPNYNSGTGGYDANQQYTYANCFSTSEENYYCCSSCNSAVP